MCHKNIVVSKNYTFNFSSLGHGGYMISANGGTWSNNNAEFNNKVKVNQYINIGVQIFERRCDNCSSQHKIEEDYIQEKGVIILDSIY